MNVRPVPGFWSLNVMQILTELNIMLCYVKKLFSLLNNRKNKQWPTHFFTWFSSFPRSRVCARVPVRVRARARARARACARQYNFNYHLAKW